MTEPDKAVPTPPTKTDPPPLEHATPGGSVSERGWVDVAQAVVGDAHTIAVAVASSYVTAKVIGHKDGGDGKGDGQS